MTSDRFHVSASKAVKEQFQQALGLAESEGRLEAAIPAANWIFGELARTPLEFGESRYDAEALQLQVRFAFVRPFAVYFAVNEQKRIVFLVRISYRT
jgi:hypothetical protein